MSDKIIELKSVNKWFGDFQVLKDVNLEVGLKQKIVVCGPSGSGKSTLIRCINRLEEHQQGQIFVDGIEVGSSSEGVVYLEGSIHSYLGADMRDYNKYLNGDINDVHIFNSALSGDEINIIFNDGIGFNPTYNHEGFASSQSLVAYYPMTAMTGTLLNDVLGEHNGEISGAIWNGDLIPTPNWLSIESDNNWLSFGQSDIIEININPTEIKIKINDTKLNSLK